MGNGDEAPVVIDSALGLLQLRLERETDRDFRFHLFCESRPAEFALLRQQLAPEAFAQLMQFQFQAQSGSYRNQFPQARFDIVEFDDRPIGRIIVDRPGRVLHIVDQAIVPAMRNKGIGTAIMRSLMDEAGIAGLPVRLKVASSNDPSMRLYQRLGFVPIQTVPLYIEMEWRAEHAPA